MVPTLQSNDSLLTLLRVARVDESPLILCSWHPISFNVPRVKIQFFLETFQNFWEKI